MDATVPGRPHADPGQDFCLEEFFDGTLSAAGEFRDPFGRLRRSFTARVTGTRLGDSIRVHEAFQYDGGAVDEREWLIRALGGGHYCGQATDVIGVAHGCVQGRSLRWSYAINLPIGGRSWRLLFDDAFELSGENELVNTARVRKFGLPVGTVRQVISRSTESPAAVG